MTPWHRVLIGFVGAVLFCIAVNAGNANAQQTALVPTASESAIDPAALTAAKNLMVVTRSERNFLQVFDLVTKRMVPLMAQANPQKQQVIEELMSSTFVPAIKQHMTEITDQIAIVYAQNFTIDEMQQLTTFYQTPVGQKYLDKVTTMMPQLMQNLQPVNQKIIKEALQALIAKMHENNLQVPKEMGL